MFGIPTIFRRPHVLTQQKAFDNLVSQAVKEMAAFMTTQTRINQELINKIKDLEKKLSGLSSTISHQKDSRGMDFPEISHLYQFSCASCWKVTVCLGEERICRFCGHTVDLSEEEMAANSPLPRIISPEA